MDFKVNKKSSPHVKAFLQIRITYFFGISFTHCESNYFSSFSKIEYKFDQES